MKIATGWDHRGRMFRGRIRRILDEMGHEMMDLGAKTAESSDYPDFAIKVAKAVRRGEADRGLLICGTGIGMSIAANKVRGIRAAVVHDEETARVSRAHNKANVLCLSESTAAAAEMAGMVRTWLTTEFDGGRHARRIGKISSYEEDRDAGAP